MRINERVKSEMFVRFLNPKRPDGVDEKDCVIQLQKEWIKSGMVEVKDDKDENCIRPLDKFWITRGKTLVLLPDEKSDEIAGYLVFFPKKDGSCEIDSLVVAEYYRGRKGGERLMEEAEKYIKEMGAKSIKLCVVSKKDKYKLIEFYKKLGYRRCNLEGEKCIMEKLLG